MQIVHHKQKQQTDERAREQKRKEQGWTPPATETKNGKTEFRTPDPTSRMNSFERGMIVNNPTTNAMAVGIATGPLIVNAPTLFKGSLTERTAGALSDATSQGVDIIAGNKKAKDFNILGPMANFAMPNKPFLSAFTSSGFETSITLDFDNRVNIFGGTKPNSLFLLEGTIGGLMNSIQGSSNNFLLKRIPNASNSLNLFSTTTTGFIFNNISNTTTQTVAGAISEN